MANTIGSVSESNALKALWDTIGSVSGTSVQALSRDDILSMPVDVAAFYLAVQQTDSLDKQIKDKMLEIQNKQADIAQAREYLAKMKELASNAKDKKDASWPSGMKEWLNAHGISYNGGTNESDWNVNIEHLNAYIQNSNSSVELDMLSIQSLMNKRNQSLEMASTIMKKSTDSKESILRNI